jgi:hypothetical protein
VIYSEFIYNLEKYKVIDFFKRYLVVILDCITYAFNLTLCIICLLSTGVDAFEDMFGFSDSHEYLEPGISEIQLYFDILPSDYDTLLSDLAFEPDTYDPFISTDEQITLDNNILEQNIQAFEQNSNLDYNVYDINGSLILVGAENTIFIMDIVQNLKDLSIETQLHIDENGNVVNTLIMDREVASLALSDAFTNLGSLSDDTLSNHSS